MVVFNDVDIDNLDVDVDNNAMILYNNCIDNIINDNLDNIDDLHDDIINKLKPNVNQDNLDPVESEEHMVPNIHHVLKVINYKGSLTVEDEFKLLDLQCASHNHNFDVKNHDSYNSDFDNFNDFDKLDVFDNDFDNQLLIQDDTLSYDENYRPDILDDFDDNVSQISDIICSDDDYMFNNIHDKFDDLDNLLQLSNLQFEPTDNEKYNIPFPQFVTRSRQVIVFPNAKQRKIINFWFNATTSMYNHVVKHIKSWRPLKTFLTLRSLYIEMKNLETLNNDLVKRMKKTKAQKDKLFKQIQTSDKQVKKNKRKRTNKQITVYNQRISQYIALKKVQKEENIDKQNIEPKLKKKTKEFNELDEKVDKLLSYKRLRTDVLHDIRDKIISKNVWRSKKEDDDFNDDEIDDINDDIEMLLIISQIKRLLKISQIKRLIRISQRKSSPRQKQNLFLKSQNQIKK